MKLPESVSGTSRWYPERGSEMGQGTAGAGLGRDILGTSDRPASGPETRFTRVAATDGTSSPIFAEAQLLFFTLNISGGQARCPRFSRPPPFLARVLMSKFLAHSISSAFRCPRRRSEIALAETPDFRPFPALEAAPTPGPNRSRVVPRRLTTCRFGTQRVGSQKVVACHRPQIPCFPGQYADNRETFPLISELIE